MAENAAGDVQGFALWFLNYSTWEGVHGIYLEDLYVSPEARGEGHGKALLQHLAATAVERGYARVEWSVLDWNEPSINFYRSLGAAPMDGWSTFRLTGDALGPSAATRTAAARALRQAAVTAVSPRHGLRGPHMPSRPGTNSAACAPRSTTSRCRWTTSAARSRRRGETITVFAREYVSAEHSEEDAAELPWLLYLQGGPGGRGNRLASLGGWSKAAARDFRILMLDQRGTGLSSPIDRNTLPLRGQRTRTRPTTWRTSAPTPSSPTRKPSARRWAPAPGPSTARATAASAPSRYLSFAPEGAPRGAHHRRPGAAGGPADRVYRATFQRVAARNAEYFALVSGGPCARSPGSPGTCATRRSSCPTAAGSPWNASRWWARSWAATPAWTRLHHLLEDAFVGTPDGDRLSDAFLEQVRGLVSRAANPLYALMHESIYGQGRGHRLGRLAGAGRVPGVPPGRREPLLHRRDGVPVVLRAGPGPAAAAGRGPAARRQGRLEAALRPGAAGR